MALTDSTSQEPTSNRQSWGLSRWRTIGAIALTLLLAITGQTLFAGVWSGVTGKDFNNVSVSGQAIFQVGLWFGALIVPVYVMLTRRLNFRNELGLRLRWTDIPLGIAIGVVLQVFVLRIVNLPLELFFPDAYEDLSAPAQDLFGGLSGSDFAVRAILAAVAAPIVEEIVFRGFIFGALLRHFRPWVALIVSSLLFGAIHSHPVSIISLAIVGLACAYAYYRTGRLGLAVAIHMGFNSVAVVALYLAR